MMTPARIAAALLITTTLACSSQPMVLNPGPEPGPRIVDFSRRVVWPVEIELPEPSYVALFSIDANLSMQYPLVPISRLERIYGAQVDIVNDRIVEFRSRHPWPHPDSVPDPFQVPMQRLDAGRHALERPYAPYIVQDLTYPPPCSYYVLIVSDLPLDFGGVFELEWLMLPRSPQDIAGAVAESLGLEAGEPGWTAHLTQGQCRRRD
ncbi:MAG TPA: hypothetical protein VJ925_13750 [Longimicrobiales bacterium]|nr:hypothetical protein [Longimicrobiales bacterium]